ncbi:DUF3568 family protein [Candidatus Omnitrophota bacterium]
MRKFMLLIFLVSFLLNACGCAPLLVAGGAVAGGAGTAGWISGKLVQELDAPLDKTFHAAKYALQSFNLVITKEIKKRDLAQIKGKYIDGKTIWIDIFQMSQATTKIALRVGAIPNKDATYKILDTIKQYLKQEN